MVEIIASEGEQEEEQEEKHSKGKNHLLGNHNLNDKYTYGGQDTGDDTHMPMTTAELAAGEPEQMVMAELVTLEAPPVEAVSVDIDEGPPEESFRKHTML